MRYSRVSAYLQCEYVRSSDRTYIVAFVRLVPLIRYESRRASRVQWPSGAIAHDIGFSPSRMRFWPIFYHFRLVHHSGTTKRTCLKRLRERRALFADDVATKMATTYASVTEKWPEHGMPVRCDNADKNICEMMKIAKKIASRQSFQRSTCLTALNRWLQAASDGMYMCEIAVHGFVLQEYSDFWCFDCWYYFLRDTKALASY